MIIILITFRPLSFITASQQGKDSLSEYSKFEYSHFEDKSIEPLPILSYDTDTGIGYGAKVFFLNQLDFNESIDLLLFNSSKGEGWYRIAFSMPDYEHRQGKIFPLAIDIVADYDKLVSIGYYGPGSESKKESKDIYSKKLFNLSFDFSRGFTPNLYGQFGIKYKSSSNSNLSEGGILIKHNDPLSRSTLRSHSVYFLFRYDTRDSYINPSQGITLQGTYEYAFQSQLVNINYTYWESSFNYYTHFLFQNTTLALKTALQTVLSERSPVQILLPLGGNKTLRGYPQDRFLDKAVTLVNSEIRFPVYKRLGAIAGFDIGKVWPSISKINLNRWVCSPALGLRFYMENFIIRLDAGFSNESTGIYLNFNHIF
ncbi:MAG: BamA/TamA family outer membrane protein [Bacillota bacterium]